MKRFLLYILCLLVVLPVFSRQALDTRLSVSDAARCLTDGDTLTIPMGDGGEVSSLWVERISSLNSSEGIRTFVAYSGSDLLGALSFDGQRISGWVMYNGYSWRVDTDADACVTVSRENCHECDGHCVDAVDGGMPAKPVASRSAVEQNGSGWSDRINGSIVYNDAILYVYRLAVPVDWPVFSSSIFGSDASRVKSYWANLEVSLNEIFGRDVGVFFVIVNDDRLIRDSADEQMYTTTDGGQVIKQSTGVVNSIIGEDSYDVSYSVSNITTSLGVAYLGAVYKKWLKAASAGHYAMSTIAHEIGHMFGAQHTFTVGGVSTIETEPGLGQSLMSYGLRKGNYFSLPSIRQIRGILARYMPYLSYPGRTETFNVDRDNGYDNIVCGIPTDNRPPVIDVAALKSKYRIPKNTYFQFHIDASDPDGDELLYMAHQSDFSGAVFVSDAPVAVPDITFQPKWSWILSDGKWKFVMDDDTDPTSTGTFHFWLGVSDGRMPESTDPSQNPHAMCYDAFETEVEVTDGTPFRITGTILRDYTAGLRLALTWNVDRSVFGEDSRVRILLSDDFGQTWKYVLKESAPNNGRCEVILPQLTFNYISMGGSRKEIRAGVIKVEEIGGIAYAVTASDPIYEQPDGSQTYSGGFRLNKSDVVFSGTPERYIVVPESEIPPVADVTATCKGILLKVSFSESREGNVISRVWEAENPSGIRYAFEQIICIRNSEPDAGIADIPGADSRWNMYVVGRTLIVGNVSGLTVDVFDLQGRWLFSRRNVTTDIERINMPSSGLYVVRVGNEARTIVVR